jgi:hypothetical protein
MAPRRGKKSRGAAAKAGKKSAKAAPTKTPRPVAKRPGLPSPDTVVEVSELTSPSGKTYRLLKTNQRDPYDPPE